MTIFLILSIIAASSGILAIYTESRDSALFHFFKPFTTIIIIVIAWAVPSSTPSIYRALIMGGLFASLAGDVFLMFPERYFIVGLGSFLLAHILYIFAFAEGLSNLLQYWVLLPLLIYGIIIYFILNRGLESLRLPVILYILVILGMVWIAANRAIILDSTGAQFVLIGGILFLISDSILAYNKFVRSFSRAQLLILGTYYIAQWFIAGSVWF